MDKHSYTEDKGENAAQKPKEPGTSKQDQKDTPRTDPGLKKGYNEKNPSEPQGGFTADSQSDEPNVDQQGDESK